jgi:hypothetical protein
MGCDIHCYIEYKTQEEKTWHGFGGCIDPGRVYYLFGRLAGVRCTSEEEFIPPRGIPEDVGWEAHDDNCLFISNVEARGTTTKAKAEHWVKEGYAKYIDNNGNPPIWVTHPDWHSHSWLTPDEWEKAIGDTELPKYQAILACLRSFEKQNLLARVVFWFDN